MNETIDRLLELARNASMSDQQREEQRRSFAFGNSNIANNHITRGAINKEAESMGREKYHSPECTTETEVLLRLPVDDWERLLRDMAGHLVGYHSWQRTLVVNLEGQLREARALAVRVEAKLK